MNKIHIISAGAVTGLGFDLPASTTDLKKGKNSRNINGKGFFQTWSQNAKVECKGVCRHIDLVMHNHTNSGDIGSDIYLMQ